jgi:hypothetical protein
MHSVMKGAQETQDYLGAPTFAAHPGRRFANDDALEPRIVQALTITQCEAPRIRSEGGDVTWQTITDGLDVC